MSLLPRLPWRALSEIAGDAAAHPQARAMAIERLQSLWSAITTGERRSFALHAPPQFWSHIWRLRDRRVIESFLQHPKLGMEALVAFIQPPLLPEHVEALVQSRWREVIPVAHQVLWAMDQTFRGPDCPLVLGHAAPWIKALSPEERLLAAARMAHPPLRRMTRAWGPSRGGSCFRTAPGRPPASASDGRAGYLDRGFHPRGRGDAGAGRGRGHPPDG